MERQRLLVIISCSAKKLWNKCPSAGPTTAKDAYISPIFSVSRDYAEEFGEKWLILSAKYGFIEPDFLIPANYNIRMGEPGSISVSELGRQVKDKGLGDFEQVDVLGSFDYFNATLAAFKGTRAIVHHVNRGVGYPPSFIKLIKGILGGAKPSLQIPKGSCSRRGAPDGPDDENPEYGRPELIEKVVPALLTFGKTVDRAELFPTFDPQAAKLITSDPYAFLLAACLDRGTRVEIIWNIPYDIKNVLGKLDPFEIGELSFSSLEELVAKLPHKPRYINDAPKTVRDLTSIVCRDCDGDARSIWKGKSSKSVRSTLFRIHGVGPGIANMIPLLIEKAFGEEFADLDHSTMDIKPDVHTIRVLFRLGLARAKTTVDALQAARVAYPPFPGKLDPPLWLIGRRWCNPTRPRCRECPLDCACQKVGV